MNFRRDGIGELKFLVGGRQPRVDDFSRVAAPSRLGEKGHDRRRLQHAHGLDREQFGIARPDADADEAALAHSRSLARALTAAAAIALPPLRPRTTIAGRPLASSASFDSAAPTKPTGMPTIAAGLGAPASIISKQTEQRGRRVADRDHRPAQPIAPEIERGGRARIADPGGERGNGGVAERADDFVVRRQPGARDTLGDHARVAKDRRAAP